MTRLLLLVRLKPRQPDGSLLGEGRRACHLVPAPDPDARPQVLTAYCGLRIMPGAGEVLASPAGVPCGPCLVRSPVVSFSLLRRLRGGAAGSVER